MVVLGDMTARFGNLSSVVGQGGELREIRRSSKDPVTNRAGRDLIARLDEQGLVVLNGVKAEMGWSFDNGRGKSVVDIISTLEDEWEDWGPVCVAGIDWMHSDHRLVKSRDESEK